jgi:hypothetical protein
MHFVPLSANKGRIDIMHVNVPDQDFKGVTAG